MRWVARHAGIVDALVLDGRGALVSASRDGSVCVHDETSRVLLRASDVADYGSYGSLAAGPRVLAGGTGWQQGLVFIDGDATRRLDPPVANEHVSCVAMRGDGVCAVGVDDDRVVLLGADGVARGAAQTEKWPYALDFSPSGDRLVVATWNAMIHVVDVEGCFGPVGEPKWLGGAGYPPGPMPFYDARWVSEHRIVVGTSASQPGEVSVGLVDPAKRGAWVVYVTDVGPIHAVAPGPSGGIAVGGGAGALMLLASDDLSERARIQITESDAAGTPPAPLVDGGGFGMHFPAAVEFDDITPGAITSLCWSSGGEELFVGMGSGAVLAVDAALG